MPPSVDTAVRDFAPEEGFAAGKLTRPQILKLSKAVLAFAEMLCDVKLYPYQREFGLRVIQSCLLSDGDEITALFSRQSGKTETVAVVICGLMVMMPTLAKYISDIRVQKFKNGFWVGLYAPSYEQANIPYRRAFQRMHSDHAATILSDEEIGISFDDHRQTYGLSLPNGSRCDCNTAAKQARIEGKTYHLIIGEESQDIDPYIWKKSVSPMGAATNASQAKIGTCNMQRSDFYEACQRNLRRDLSLEPNQLRNHFQFDYEVAAKYNPFYRQYVQKEIARLGFDSDEFRMAYRLHWILERGMFIEPTMFDLLGKDYTITTFDNKNEVVVGIDVGKADASSVVTVVQPDYTRGGYVGEDDFRCHKRVLNWLELLGDDYEQQIRHIIAFLDNYRKKKRIMVDATGVGQAIYDMLRAHYRSEIDSGDLEVLEFMATVQTNHDGYQRLLLDLQNERIEYPNSERSKKLGKQRKFVTQMLNLQKAFRGAYLGAEAGELTPHKDYASSLMIACYACDAAEQTPEMETESPVSVFGARRQRSFADRSAPWWKTAAAN